MDSQEPWLSGHFFIHDAAPEIAGWGPPVSDSGPCQPLLTLLFTHLWYNLPRVVGSPTGQVPYRSLPDPQRRPIREPFPPASGSGSHLIPSPLVSDPFRRQGHCPAASGPDRRQGHCPATSGPDRRQGPSPPVYGPGPVQDGLLTGPPEPALSPALVRAAVGINAVIPRHDRRPSPWTSARLTAPGASIWL
jgi:hypothetical protein